MKKIAKTKITNSSLTTIPKPVKLFLGIKNGDSVEWFVSKENIVVKRANKYDKR